MISTAHEDSLERKVKGQRDGSSWALVRGTRQERLPRQCWVVIGAGAQTSRMLPPCRLSLKGTQRPEYAVSRNANTRRARADEDNTFFC